MLTPGTDSGSPADSQAFRAMSIAWGPICETQPMITSSTAAGSTPVRETSSASTCAARSTGWTEDSPPFRRPTGVRTAPTMYACDTSTSCGATGGLTACTEVTAWKARRDRGGGYASSRALRTAEARMADGLILLGLLALLFALGVARLRRRIGLPVTGRALAAAAAALAITVLLMWASGR